MIFGFVVVQCGVFYKIAKLYNFYLQNHKHLRRLRSICKAFSLSLKMMLKS